MKKQKLVRLLTILTFVNFPFEDHMKKHQRLAEAEMKKKALALELKRERELRKAKEDMYEDKRVKMQNTFITTHFFLSGFHDVLREA